MPTTAQGQGVSGGSGGQAGTGATGGAFHWYQCANSNRPGAHQQVGVSGGICESCRVRMASFPCERTVTDCCIAEEIEDPDTFYYQSGPGTAGLRWISLSKGPALSFRSFCEASWVAFSADVKLYIVLFWVQPCKQSFPHCLFLCLVAWEGACFHRCFARSNWSLH